VLGQTYEGGCCGYNHAQYDVWDPAAGDFVPHWTRGLDPVYGPVPEGRAAFAAQQITAPAMAACLVRLDGVRDLSATGKVCPPGMLIGSLQWALAPDGRSLVDRAGESGAVYDLDSVLETGRPVASCPTGFPVAWEDPTHVLLGAGTVSALTRCDVTTGVESSVDGPPGTSAATNRVVPRYPAN
jgi:hypothetical protein